MGKVQGDKTKTFMTHRRGCKASSWAPLALLFPFVKSNMYGKHTRQSTI